MTKPKISEPSLILASPSSTCLLSVTESFVCIFKMTDSVLLPVTVLAQTLIIHLLDHGRHLMGHYNYVTLWLKNPSQTSRGLEDEVGTL